MFRSSLRRLVGCSALAGAVLAAAAMPAQAIVYVGTFDPAFGIGQPNLGFRGSVKFSIPDACLALTGVIANGNACSSGGMQNLNASVEFYDVNDPLQTTLLTQGFIDQPLVDAKLGGGTLVGPDSLAIHATNVQVPNLNNIGLLFNGDLWLQFLTPAQQPLAFLYSCDPATCVLDNTTQSNPAPVLLTQVPEPAAIGLALAALGAAAAASRRRRAG